MLSVRFTLTRGEVLTIGRAYQLRSWSTWVFLALGVLALAYGIVVSNIGDMATAALYIAVAATFVFVYLPARSWRRYTHLRSEQVITFSDEEIARETAGGSSRTRWDHWSKVEVLSDLYVMTSRERGWAAIPRRAFSSSADEHAFKQITASHLASSFSSTKTPSAA